VIAVVVINVRMLFYVLYMEILGLLKQVPAFAGWGEGGNITFAK